LGAAAASGLVGGAGGGCGGTGAPGEGAGEPRETGPGPEAGTDAEAGARPDAAKPALDGVVQTDLLIIGTGLAGMWAAVTARDYGVADVAFVDKGAIGHSSMSKMCSGSTIYLESGDDLATWLRDFVRAVRFLCPQDIVQDIFETSGARLEKLRSWGMSYEDLRMPSRGFDQIQMRTGARWQSNQGGPVLEGGAALVGALLEQIAKRQIRGYSKTQITALLTRGGRVSGAVGVHRITGKPLVFKARAVILAAADCSFRGHYACVDGVTGDGFRLAFDAGVRLNNMEFLVTNTGAPDFGWEGTGICAQFGAKFLDAHLQPFMQHYSQDADKAEIWSVVQAMASERAKGNGPPFFFDMTSPSSKLLAKLWDQYTSGYMQINRRKLLDAGIDLYALPLAWGPAIQSLRGGVRTDLGGQSDLPGLFAAGMSQSVTPCLFNGWSTMRAMGTGERVGRAAARFLADASDTSLDADEVKEACGAATAPLAVLGGPRPDDVCAKLQALLFPCSVSVRKSGTALSAALAAVEAIRDEDVPRMGAADPHGLRRVHETANMVRVAELFLRASLERTESRLDHAREEYPQTDDAAWLRWVNLRKSAKGAVEVSFEGIPLSTYPIQPS
jgi:succinate dehydrogenase/fumarate reductase flavoprotein subunit